jgi:hypothetical protein
VLPATHEDRLNRRPELGSSALVFLIYCATGVWRYIVQVSDDATRVLPASILYALRYGLDMFRRVCLQRRPAKDVLLYVNWYRTDGSTVSHRESLQKG